MDHRLLWAQCSSRDGGSTRRSSMWRSGASSSAGQYLWWITRTFPWSICVGGGCHIVILRFHYCFFIWAVTWQNQQCGCVPSEDSDQPGYPPSLIRVFAVRMKKAWILSYPLSTQRRLIRLGGCPGWSESSLGAHSFCWFCHVTAHATVVKYLFVMIWKNVIGI